MADIDFKIGDKVRIFRQPTDAEYQDIGLPLGLDIKTFIGLTGEIKGMNSWAFGSNPHARVQFISANRISVLYVPYCVVKKIVPGINLSFSTDMTREEEIDLILDMAIMGAIDDELRDELLRVHNNPVIRYTPDELEAIEALITRLETAVMQYSRERNIKPKTLGDYINERR